MNEILSQLLDAARSDASLKKALLASETAADPMAEFCRAASEAGFPVTVGELFAMGQEYTDNLLKSVNGGAGISHGRLGGYIRTVFGGIEDILILAISKSAGSYFLPRFCFYNYQRTFI